MNYSNILSELASEKHFDSGIGPTSDKKKNFMMMIIQLELIPSLLTRLVRPWTEK